MSGPGRERAVARIDVAAIEQNCRTLAAKLERPAQLCAVVKADGYGHGAVACATAALRGGATRLAVATAGEAEELRSYLPGTSILVMGALTVSELERALAVDAEIGLWRPEYASAAGRIAAAMGKVARIHIKHDSGMGRLGESDPAAVLALARAVVADGDLELAGAWTHFATADEPDRRFLEWQLGRFTEVAFHIRAMVPGVTVHAANSAATLRMPEAHFDMVRCGVAIYGLSPFQGDPIANQLVPSMTFAATVAAVKRFERGASAGYGRRWAAGHDTWVAVLPVGYGDGVRRAMTNNGEVLIRGRRHPIVGTVSMDNITVELGPRTDVEVGDEAILIGRQGREQILAEEVARRIDTINYEITCGVSARVPRERHR